MTRQYVGLSPAGEVSAASSPLKKCGTGILPVILLVIPLLWPPLTGEAAPIHRLEAGATQENQVLQQADRAEEVLAGPMPACYSGPRRSCATA